MRVKHVPSLVGTPVAVRAGTRTESGDDAVAGGDGETPAAGDDGVGDGDRETAADGTLASAAPDATADYVADVQAAVPLVPGTEDDCCARLQRRLGYESRDVSRTWLTFLRGIDLAVETDEGFRRTRESADAAGLRERLFGGVLGATELGTALAAADESFGVADGFAAVEPLVPRWERTRTDDWETVWRERVTRLFDWFVALELAERVGGEGVEGEGTAGYRGTAALDEVLATADATEE
ncbi:hypothetical protein RYH80_08020 [Halobaculum sp. MBLA0147]|uniref:hypothetical protein n=1 Tax=Halobaculum sp. MBLA0147 TaxID=3079934 RepID=UPI003525D680